MASYVSIVSGILLLPVFYVLFLLWYRADFERPENQRRSPLHSSVEKMVVLVSEAALIRFWFALDKTGFYNLNFTLFYIILVGMTVFCMTDLWEHVVPNKILLILLLLFLIAAGIQALRDVDGLTELFPSMVLGVLFCALCFGLGYLFSRKSMGAGDVKLSLVMGLFLTGEYVVGAVLYGCLVSAGYSVVQMLRKKLSRKDVIPFVPFLYIGLVIRCFVE